MSLSTVILGGRQAGCVGLLTLLAARCDVRLVVAYDDMVRALALQLKLPVEASVEHPQVVEALGGADLLVSVHGREIVSARLYERPVLGAINVHPCLYAYKGANPVQRLLRDGNPRASVGAHVMTAEVDAGPVLVEEFVDVTGLATVEAVYNALYPTYAVVLLEAVEALRDGRAYRAGLLPDARP